MLEYHQVFVKWIKSLPPQPYLSDFYHPSEGQRNGELLFVKVGAGLEVYVFYKYLKVITDKILNEGYYQPDHL